MLKIPAYEASPPITKVSQRGCNNDSKGVTLRRRFGQVRLILVSHPSCDRELFELVEATFAIVLCLLPVLEVIVYP